jgi:hypothetical protein
VTLTDWNACNSAVRMRRLSKSRSEFLLVCALTVMGSRCVVAWFGGGCSGAGGMILGMLWYFKLVLVFASRVMRLFTRISGGVDASFAEIDFASEAKEVFFCDAMLFVAAVTDFLERAVVVVGSREKKGKRFKVYLVFGSFGEIRVFSLLLWRMTVVLSDGCLCLVIFWCVAS